MAEKDDRTRRKIASVRFGFGTPSPAGTPAASAGASPVAALRALARSTGARAHLLLLVAAAGVGAFLPLTDHLGYELAELLALLSGSGGLATGVSAGRRAREGHGPIPCLLAALFWNGAALLVALGLALLNGLRRPACDPPAGLVFAAAIPLPSALLGAAAGFWCAALSPRRAGWLAAALWLATLAEALWPVLTGPQVFVLHDLGGFFPGPIYDEAIAATPALWSFRAGTILWTLALGALGVAALERGPSRAWSRAAGVAALLCAVALAAAGERLHWRTSSLALDAVLGATETGPRVRLHLPREKPLADRRRLLADAEASAAEVLEVFGAATSSPALIDVYLFRSASEKRQLLGASDTSFTKPWLRQIHTNDAPAPHPILRHELVHALAADWSSGPFGVPGRLGGLLPDMAFIEGFAVAGDWPAGESTVDEEAAALRRLGRAPDLVALFAPGRFYAEAGPNAYTLAGSFVRFLVARSGGGAVRAAYGSPRGIEALGPLPALAREHAAYLDRLAVPETVRALAALRFSQPALARRTCPHEVAALREEAGRAGARGDRRLAGELWARCVALEPDDPGLLLQERRALLAANDPDGAGRIAARALAHPKLSQPQRAQLLVEEGDAALRRGQLDAAAAHYGEAALLPQAEAATRAVEARRSALAQPGWQMVAVRLFGAGDTGPDTLRLLAELDDAQPGEGFAAYLLAKQAQNRGDWAECLRTVRRARGRKLPGPLFLAEALRVQAACAAGRGDSAAGREALEALAKDPLESHRLEAVRALRRLGTGPG